jgi:hypothetical protein
MAESKRVTSSTTEAADEGNGWIVFRRLQPELNGLSASTLLDLAAGLPGWSRYVRDTGISGGIVLLVAEICCAGEDAARSGTAIDRWLAQLDSEDAPAESPREDAIEGVLSQSGLAFVRRDASWAAPAPAGLPTEIVVSPLADGVRVEAMLAAWDEVSAPSRDALAEFLLAAQRGLRCARAELGSQLARVTALVRTESLDPDLLHGLRGVSAGARALAREASMLLSPEAAGLYQELRARPARGPDSGRAWGDEIAGVIDPVRSVPSFPQV